jgi:hypothetical protein
MTNTNSKENLEKLIDELCNVGEDREELTLWLNLYDILSEEEKSTLVANLEKELKQLKALK